MMGAMLVTVPAGGSIPTDARPEQGWAFAMSGGAMFHVPTFTGTAACADRLDLVDAGYKSPGKADELKALCTTCPIAAECLDTAMVNGEAGVWGGTGPYARTQHGSLNAQQRKLRRGATAPGDG